MYTYSYFLKGFMFNRAIEGIYRMRKQVTFCRDVKDLVSASFHLI